MNILHVIPYYAPAWAYGGAVRAATDLTCALVTEGHNVYVLTTDTLSPSERTSKSNEVIGGVVVNRVRNWSNTLRGRLNLSTPIRIGDTARRLIRQHAIDVIHCHEVRTVENLRVVPVANREGVPVVVSPHGTLPHGTGRGGVKQVWDSLFGRRLLPRFDQVIALTANEATDAHSVWESCGLTLPDERISVVPNGVHVADFAQLPSGETFRQQWRLGHGPVVLFLGRLHERKGLHLLIPAFGEVVKQAPDAHLLIVGPDEGMLAKLTMLVDEHNLAGRVTFTGLLTGNDRLAAFAAADIFTLPAVGEGFSMAVLEAMACGLPVLLTPGCNFPEVVAAGAGLVVERETSALSVALKDLLIDADCRDRMGRAAQDLIHMRFTWPHVIQQLEVVYQAVINRR